MIPPARVALGGREIDIEELCLIQGKIEGLGFLADAVPVDEPGRADGPNWMFSLGLSRWNDGRSGWIPRAGRWIWRG